MDASFKCNWGPKRKLLTRFVRRTVTSSQIRICKRLAAISEISGFFRACESWVPRGFRIQNSISPFSDAGSPVIDGTEGAAADDGLQRSFAAECGVHHHKERGDLQRFIGMKRSNPQRANRNTHMNERI
ncbi:hypothetical protein L596_018863 [Steinernema carpocapsae]|uniref:Uncharacterized protein n=1 Tax=Steinernema carpocapsae TaxID=34508 RepID=A0A4U5N6M2_STECR|nr:hypothetical protein L596_018863 [Steinernema carpocapsae]